jgi:hypothetical protein
MVELHDFVSETIKHVIDGVITAHEHAKSKGATVIPKFKIMDQSLQSISFDVAVTAAEGTKTQGSIGVFIVGVLGLGSKGQSEKTSESANRIQFSIPISLPFGNR